MQNEIKKYLLRKKLIAINHSKEKPERVGLLIPTKTGEQWANGFRSLRTEQLRKGEEVWLYLWESEYSGKKYLNFELPSIDFLIGMNKATDVVTQKQPSQVTDEQLEEIDRAFGIAK